MSNRTIPILLLIDGFACAVVAIFAHALGLDPTDAWGRSRLLLLVVGVVLVCGSLYLIGRGQARIDAENTERIQENSAPVRVHPRSILEKLNSIFESENAKTVFSLAHIWVIIFAIYIWFITFGNFTTWTHTSHYYTRLADAFAQGHLYVDLDPGPLLEAADPYDPKGRAPFQDEIWDMSYYNGKLYFYWGPAPSLLITPVQMLTGKKISDSQLVFFFFAALLIVNSLIILKLWRRFFPSLPAWNIFASIALIGLILPILWETGVPYVYEVAVGAGQFFLMGGIYFALSALAREEAISGRDLSLAGLFWAASVGSRALNVFSVIFLALLASARIIQSLPKPLDWKKLIRLGAALFVPLGIGAIVIAWYNWARFDSPFEFGLRYQVTTYNLNKLWNLTFQLEYFPTNFYVYFLQPFGLIPKFPFLQPVSLASLWNQQGVTAPHLYYAGRLTGILFSAPFLLLGLVPLLSKREAAQTLRWNEARSIQWVILILAGSTIIEFLTILFYFNAQVRFLVDLISQVTLLAVLGYWQLTMSARSRIWVTLANLLLGFTVVASFLLSLSSETSRFETLNPLLFETINRILGLR